MGQLGRAVQVLRFLQLQPEASFGELLKVLEPVSRTTLSALLRELIELGELEHHGRSYRLADGMFSHRGLLFNQLPEGLRKRTQAVLAQTASETGHACALFARVGQVTMKIVDQHNLGGAHWSFAPIGHEWPLVPFHGFAKVFLAHADEAVMHSCYTRWSRFLRSDLLPPTLEALAAQLAAIREKGYALEYREELKAILRLVVPVWLPGYENVQYAVGLVARYVYLLEVDDCLPPLQRAASALGDTLSLR